MDKSAAPSLLPILRSQQQGELLALLLGDPERERTLAEIARDAGVPYASVHREIERAERTGIVVSREVGRSRLVRANTASPYFVALSELLTKAFGPPALLAASLSGIPDIRHAYIFGSWARAAVENRVDRPIGDIDLLVLGSPDRERVYAAVADVETRLGRPVQVTVRAADWLSDGSGDFHDTVTSRPMVELSLTH